MPRAVPSRRAPRAAAGTEDALPEMRAHLLGASGRSDRAGRAIRNSGCGAGREAELEDDDGRLGLGWCGRCRASGCKTGASEVAGNSREACAGRGEARRAACTRTRTCAASRTRERRGSSGAARRSSRRARGPSASELRRSAASRRSAAPRAARSQARSRATRSEARSARARRRFARRRHRSARAARKTPVASGRARRFRSSRDRKCEARAESRSRGTTGGSAANGEGDAGRNGIRRNRSSGGRRRSPGEGATRAARRQGCSRAGACSSGRTEGDDVRSRSAASGERARAEEA